MKKVKLYVVRELGSTDEITKVYLDKASAEIALVERFTEEAIKTGKASVETIDAVSYMDMIQKKETT